MASLGRGSGRPYMATMGAAANSAFAPAKATEAWLVARKAGLVTTKTSSSWVCGVDACSSQRQAAARAREQSAGRRAAMALDNGRFERFAVFPRHSGG
mmetsp:Transcript_69946/g.112854  ORF Transcript_69946/g.112854 Transcript_69946/m.112854 type:complete len:98 (-) Transcript_69946:11-304(-)